MMRLIATLILIFLPYTVEAAPPSLLGMCHKTWDCKRTEALFKSKIVTGWIENTFGEACACADKLLQSEKPKVIRIHLVNSPCMRNRRCGRYELLYGETKVSASRKIVRGDRRILERFNAILERAAKRIESSKGRLQCYVSPCLECDLNANARRILLDAVSARLSNCVLVDNPHGQSCLKGYVCESHGANPKVRKPCIVDMDGKDGRELNVNSWVEKYRSCDLRFYWEPSMNCIGGSFIDPRRRNTGWCSVRR
jgi:hypothetical protein